MSWIRRSQCMTAAAKTLGITVTKEPLFRVNRVIE
jgi:hypothetical protein